MGEEVGILQVTPWCTMTCNGQLDKLPEREYTPRKPRHSLAVPGSLLPSVISSNGPQSLSVGSSSSLALVPMPVPVQVVFDGAMPWIWGATRRCLLLVIAGRRFMVSVLDELVAGRGRACVKTDRAALKKWFAMFLHHGARCVEMWICG